MASDRREFLRTVGACGLACASASLLNGCLVGELPQLELGTIDAAGQIALGAPATLKGLLVPGSAVILRAGGVSAPLLLVRRSDNGFAALSAVCTHASCTVSFDAASGQVECPCHRSLFALDDGHVVRAPATVALPVYGTRIDASGSLVIETRGGTHSRYPAIVNGTLSLDLTAFPELATTGSSIAFTPSGYGGPMLLARVGALDFIATDGTCTFAPCILGYDLATGLFRCPCHGCSYELGGKVASGPATTALRTFTAHFDLSGQTVTIQIPPGG